MPRRHTLVTTAAVTLLVSGLGTTVAHADPVTDLYVNVGLNACNDNGPGTLAVPYCGIQAAADAAQPGQTVHVSLAYYTKPVVITHSGEPGKPITFDGATGSARAYVRTAGTSAFTVSGAHDIAFSHLQMSSAGAAALRVVGSRDISFDSGVAVTVVPFPVPSTPEVSAVAIDGSSQSIALSRLALGSYMGWGVETQPGASKITLADDIFPTAGVHSLGGVHADGVTGLALAGDSFTAICGSAVNVTGASSGSIENVAAQYANGAATGSACLAPGSAAEISVSADSASQIHSDYNAVGAGQFGVDYLWGGTPYTSSKSFYTGTAQGADDIDQLPSNSRIEHSPLIDSGDANAPGELPTDFVGKPRVDDPLVPNTGTGVGYVDRGAFEFQDPGITAGLTSSSPVNSSSGPYPLTVTLTATASDPWAPNAAYSYTFDPGDGTGTVTTSNPVFQHVYTKPPANGANFYAAYVSVTAPGATTRSTATTNVSVRPNGPLVTTIGLGRTDPQQPDTTSVVIGASSPWSITGYSADFVGGSGVTNLQPQDFGSPVWGGFSAPGTYTVTGTATDANGSTASASQQVTVGTAFIATAPQRVLDTRYGIGAPQRQVGPGSVTRVKIAGANGIPATGVTAVTMNVTDTYATASSWITAYADGTPLPNASSLNFQAGQTNPNQITVPVNADGYVDLYNAKGNVDLFADVQGYYTLKESESPTQSNFAASGPTRVLDTRFGIGGSSGAVGPDSTTTVTLPTGSVPMGATAVALNVTATWGDATSWVTVYPAAAARPNVSNLNFHPGQTTSNLVVVPIDKNNQVRIYNHAGHVHLFADVQGYYTTGSGGAPFVPVAPTRAVDTRFGIGAPKLRLGDNSVLRVKVAGVGGVPQGANSVLVNLTGSWPSTHTWLTAYGNGGTPNASNINLVPGQTRPVLAVVPVTSDGYINIYNAHGTVDLFADIEGYYAT